MPPGGNGESRPGLADAAHSDPAPALSVGEVGKDGQPELGPRAVDLGQHDDEPPAQTHQRTQAAVTRRPPDGVEQRVAFGVGVLEVGVSAIDDHHPVGPLDVVADGAGQGHRSFAVTAREQLVQQVPAQPALGLDDTLETGQFHGQDGGAMLQRDVIVRAGEARRVHEGDDSDQVFARAGNGDEAAVFPHRLSLFAEAQEHAHTRVGRVLPGGLRRPGTGPGQEIAVAVLDGDFEAGELVQGIGDALLPLALDGHAGQAGVDRRLALEGTDGLGQCVVGGPKGLGGGAVALVEPRVGEGDTGLL